MEEKHSQNQIEFDLIAIVKTGWINRKVLIISGVIGCILGIVVSLLSLDKYSSNSLIIPNSNQNSGVNGGIASLASFAGIRLGAGTGEIFSLLMYPKLVRSIPFVQEVMDSKIEYNGDSIRVADYLLNYSNHPKVKAKQYTIGLPKFIFSKLKPKAKEVSQGNKFSQIVILTPEQLDIYKLLNEFIEIIPDIEEGYVTISCTLYEPVPAAQLTSLVSNLLQKKITEIKIEKAKANLDFIERRFIQAKGKFLDKQIELADYKDRNIGVSTEFARIEEKKLQDDYNLLYSIYMELAKNLENAKISVQEDTPIFSVIQPAIVPSEKSSMGRKVQVILWTILGGFFGIAIVAVKVYRGLFIKRWQQIDN